MRWPWQKIERRESQSYTDVLVNSLLSQAQGTQGAGATAALEACACLYGCAFSAAKVEGADRFKRVLNPTTLSLIARSLIRRGESLHLIDVAGGMLRLLPVGTWDVRGDFDPASWRYRVDLFGPSGSTVRYVSQEQVLHVMYSINAARPWRGIGPLQFACDTAGMAGGLESTLSNEASAPSAQVLPVPVDGGDDDDNSTNSLAILRTDLANARGRTMLVESMNAGWGEGEAVAPRQDWTQKRIGAEWPAVLQETRTELSYAIGRACGVPTALLNPKSEGTSQREGLRRFAHFAVEPLARTVETYLRKTLDAPDLSLTFGALMASDLAGKARAVKGFVEAGFSLKEAATIAGLMGYRD